ncbi:MAG: hypothetical protein HYY06_25440 [Deltaproteobacteria bacterium]|nr:hypothetical protein [Deltaproteobacteria bacterium]
MRALALAVLLAACVPEPIPRTVTPSPARRSSHVRSDRRLLRENRELRRELRALRQELAAARSATTAEAEARRAEGRQQAATAEALAQQIGVLSTTIGRLERILQIETPVAAQGRRPGGSFSKIRLGTVPAQTPTPPGPRPNMDAPAQWNSPPDLLNPFSKGPVPGVGER